MKKIMYIAAALLVLVGCQKSQEAKENAPVNYGTITGKIELPQGPNKISATKGWSKSGDIQMQWEEGDEVLIGNESGMKLLTLKSIDENGVATFEGELLSNMSSYMVFYGFNPLEMDEDIVVPYIEDNYRPFAMGYGTDGSFTIEDFSPVFGMPLKGTAALTKIEASYEVALTYNLTMTFEDSLQLTSTSQTIYFPIYSSFEEMPLTFKFYDAGGLILTKTIEEATCYLNQVITFESALEVNGTAPAPTHDYVDLGLPSGLKWATCNVGATNPEDYGDYFAWGETATKSDYSWGSYKYMQSGQSDWLYITKYTYPDDQTDGIWYNGDDTFIGDNKTVLELADDAAAVNWGGAWRMPTVAEFQELLNNCDYAWTDNYNSTGVKGWLFTSKKEGYTDKSIFLPAASYFDGTSLYDDVSYGDYWSASLDTSGSDYGRHLYFTSGNVGLDDGNDRYCGLSVRPVCP